MKYYQGDTRQKIQLCDVCEQPTGRCEDDTLENKYGKILCEDCYDTQTKENDV